MYGAFHAARFLQNPAPGVAYLPRRRRPVSTRSALHARSWPEMACQIRALGSQNGLARFVWRARQPRRPTPRLISAVSKQHFSSRSGSAEVFVLLLVLALVLPDWVWDGWCALHLTRYGRP